MAPSQLLRHGDTFCRIPIHRETAGKFLPAAESKGIFCRQPSTNITGKAASIAETMARISGKMLCIAEEMASITGRVARSERFWLLVKSGKGAGWIGRPQVIYGTWAHSRNVHVG